MTSRFFIVAFFLTAFAQAFAGGPWTPGRTEGSVTGSVTPVVYKSYALPDGGSADLRRRVTDVTIGGYFELGITDRLALLGNLELRYAGTSQKGFDTDDFPLQPLLAPDRTFGMGNSSVGFKYRFTGDERNMQFGLSFTTEFPASNKRIGTGIQTGYDAWTFLPGLHIGQRYVSGFFFYAEAWYGAHTRLSDEVRVAGEIGYTFLSPVSLSLSVSSKQSIHNRIYGDGYFAQTGLYLNDQEHLTVGLKIVREISESFGFRMEMSGRFLTEYMAVSPVISAGCYYNWKGRSTEVQEP